MANRDRSRSPRGGQSSNTDEILSLIFMREQARQGKDFAQADQIRDRLLAMDVTLFDKTSQWRAGDGRVGKIPSWSDIENGTTPDALIDQSGSNSEPGVYVGISPSDPEAHIKGLVQQREQARAHKDFAQSDQLREELKGLGVEVFDKEKMWRNKDGTAGVIIGYRSTGGPTDMEINALIAQREKARQNNDYATADMIRDELKQRGVSIMDKEKSWKSIDGRAGGVPMFNGGGQQPGQMHVPATMPQQFAQHAGHGGHGGHYGHASVPIGIQQQIMSLALQASQDPSMAQRALTSLKHAVHGMPMAPQAAAQPRMQMQAPVNRAAPAPLHRGAQVQAGPEVGEALAFCAQAAQRSLSNEEILWLVDLRERQRKNGDYSSSDAIRDAMKQCSVELHEKEKRWQTSDGRTGMIPAWSDLA